MTPEQEQRSDHRRAMLHLWNAFEDFMRNGVFGECVCCPTTTGERNGRKLPEKCQYFLRHDHQLSINQLVEAYERRLKDAKTWREKHEIRQS